MESKKVITSHSTLETSFPKQSNSYPFFTKNEHGYFVYLFIIFHSKMQARNGKKRMSMAIVVMPMKVTCSFQWEWWCPPPWPPWPWRSQPPPWAPPQGPWCPPLWQLPCPWCRLPPGACCPPPWWPPCPWCAPPPWQARTFGGGRWWPGWGIMARTLWSLWICDWEDCTRAWWRCPPLWPLRPPCGWCPPPWPWGPWCLW